jgi:hypothetical protein
MFNNGSDSTVFWLIVVWLIGYLQGWWGIPLT